MITKMLIDTYSHNDNVHNTLHGTRPWLDQPTERKDRVARLPVKLYNIQLITQYTINPYIGHSKLEVVKQEKIIQENKCPFKSAWPPTNMAQQPWRTSDRNYLFACNMSSYGHAKTVPVDQGSRSVFGNEQLTSLSINKMTKYPITYSQFPKSIIINP